MDSLIDIIQESLYGSDNKLDKYRHLINSIENLQQYEKDIVLFSKLYHTQGDSFFSPCHP